MDTDNYLFEAETREIIECAYEVSNTLGHGLLEKPYENALVVEFIRRRIPVQQQITFNVMYKDVKVGEYIPDLIVFERIIVDTKTVDKITNHEVGQMLNYLKITNLQVGLILNFKQAKVECRRVVRTK